MINEIADTEALEVIANAVQSLAGGAELSEVEIEQQILRLQKATEIMLGLERGILELETEHELFNAALSPMECDRRGIPFVDIPKMEYTGYSRTIVRTIKK